MSIRIGSVSIIRRSPIAEVWKSSVSQIWDSLVLIDCLGLDFCAHFICIRPTCFDESTHPWYARRDLVEIPLCPNYLMIGRMGHTQSSGRLSQLLEFRCAKGSSPVAKETRTSRGV